MPNLFRRHIQTYIGNFRCTEWRAPGAQSRVRPKGAAQAFKAPPSRQEFQIERYEWHAV